MPAVVERLVGKPHTELRTPDEIMTAFEALHPTYKIFGPDLLYSLWRHQRLDVELLRRLLLDVWIYTDFPTAGCPARAWRAMFKRTGYLPSDGVPKPTRRRVLYRGCTPKGRRGMSWTSKRFVAERFADYWVEHGYGEAKPGHVYKAVVEPNCVLAIIRGRLETLNFNGAEVEVPVGSEHEFIIDARALSVTLVETARERIARVEREEVRLRRRFENARRTP